MGRKHIGLFCCIALVSVLVLSGCQTNTFDYYIENVRMEGDVGSVGTMKTAFVLIGDRLAHYQYVHTGNHESLQQFIGEPYQTGAVLLNIEQYVDLDAEEVENADVIDDAPIITEWETDNCNWYYPTGRQNLQYLIQEMEDGSLTVWKYHRLYVNDFAGEEKQIFRNIYAEAYPAATNFSEYTKEEENRLIFSD